MSDIAFASDYCDTSSTYATIIEDTQEKEDSQASQDQTHAFVSVFSDEEIAAAEVMVEARNLRNKSNCELTEEEALALVKANQYHHESTVVCSGITVDDVLATIDPEMLASAMSTSSDVSGTYVTDELNTGTDGVNWRVTIEYVLSQRANGDYYFKSVTKGSIEILRNEIVLGLVYGCLITETENRHHMILNNGTTIRVEADWNFTAYYPNAVFPISWTEYHYHDTPVAHVSPE